MSAKVTYNHEPDYAVPPGETLLETLEELGMNQKELATKTGLTRKTINQIVKGKHPLSQDTAIKLDRVTGVPARIWNNLEMKYQERLAAQKDQERIKDSIEWLKKIPVSELKKRGVLSKVSDKIQLLKEVFNFFGVTSKEEWEEYWLKSVSFRKSSAFETKQEVMTAWIRLGELSARHIECAEFTPARFRKSLETIRSITNVRPKEWQEKIINECARSGVAVVFIPKITGCPASGATQWDRNKAIMQLSLRYKTDDHFWFTFFHEAGHILFDSRKEIIIDNEQGSSESEIKANKFATDFLIPPKYQKELPSLKSETSVRDFAKKINIAPGIVVGQLQYRKIISYTYLNKLKRKLAWKEA